MLFFSILSSLVSHAAILIETPLSDQFPALPLYPLYTHTYIHTYTGGWSVASFSSAALSHILENELTNQTANGTDDVVMALGRAFERTDRTLLHYMYFGVVMGFASFARVGACALAIFVRGRDLYVANGKSPNLTLRLHMMETKRSFGLLHYRLSFSMYIFTSGGLSCGDGSTGCQSWLIIPSCAIK